jgi:hypothetical protein
VATAPGWVTLVRYGPVTVNPILLTLAVFIAFGVAMMAYGLTTFFV